MIVLQVEVFCFGCTAGPDIDSPGKVRRWSTGSKRNRHGVSGGAAMEVRRHVTVGGLSYETYKTVC